MRAYSWRQVLGDSALLKLAAGCDSALLQLDLSSCCFVTDTGLLAALHRCPCLRDLTLSGCAQITDQVLFFSSTIMLPKLASSLIPTHPPLRKTRLHPHFHPLMMFGQQHSPLSLAYVPVCFFLSSSCPMACRFCFHAFLNTRRRRFTCHIDARA